MFNFMAINISRGRGAHSACVLHGTAHHCLLTFPLLPLQDFALSIPNPRPALSFPCSFSFILTTTLLPISSAALNNVRKEEESFYVVAFFFSSLRPPVHFKGRSSHFLAQKCKIIKASFVAQVGDGCWEGCHSRDCPLLTPTTLMECKFRRQLCFLLLEQNDMKAKRTYCLEEISNYQE